MILETSRLLIRPILPKDASALYRYRKDIDSNRYQSWIPKTLEEAMLFIKNTSSLINTPNTWFQLVVLEKKSNVLIGDIGLHFFDENNKQVEVGCTLDKHFQGNGFATEALFKILDLLFNDFSKHRITASVDPDNLSSIKLLERLGFRKEAHFKKSLCMDGKWIDDVIYAILEEEYKNSSIHANFCEAINSTPDN